MDIQDVHDTADRRNVDLGAWCQDCGFAQWENNGPSSPGGWDCTAKRADECLYYIDKLQGEDDE